MSNLREIQKLGMMYADFSASHTYPWSKDGGIAALEMLNRTTEGLRPILFICPRSGLEPAEVDGDGKFRLDSEHSSYELVPWRISPNDPASSLVAFDRQPWHDGRRHAIFADGSVESLRESVFQEKYAADKKRFEGKAEESPRPKKPSRDL
jgi:prepilin-type processing-associated H-X9-DG protein